ncbi:MAG: hypothetical protein KC503_14555 [Myxococcales bacterium]|nr:hypothetical protein [Myxococcales bacterium]
MVRTLASLLLTLVLFGAAGVREARANPWTRGAGKYFIGLSYSRIAATGYYGPDTEQRTFPGKFTQNQLSTYIELGVIDRWLMMVIDGTLWRHASIEGAGDNGGLGDLRIGFWSNVVRWPLNVSLGVMAGVPTGEARRLSRGLTGAEGVVSRTLRTGDGEGDVELGIALGRSFGGGGSVWPLEHYVVLQAGYWLRTRGFADALRYRAEFGTRYAGLPVLDRLWVIVRFLGIESFASNAETTDDASGVGSGVTVASWGVEAYVRILGGLGVSFSFAGAFRARALPAGANMTWSLSYQK